MFRFSIRELLLLTAVAALAVGWTTSARENQRLGMENHRVQKANERIWSAYLELRDFSKPIDDSYFAPTSGSGGFKSPLLLHENPGKPRFKRKGDLK